MILSNFLEEMRTAPGFLLPPAQAALGEPARNPGALPCFLDHV
jgi:hypothetical protein